jgi:hypothetical protein
VAVRVADFKFEVAGVAGVAYPLQWQVGPAMTNLENFRMATFSQQQRHHRRFKRCRRDPPNQSIQRRNFCGSLAPVL